MTAAPERCPACDEAPRPTRIRRGASAFVRCPSCRSLWQCPIPSDARLAEIYGYSDLPDDMRADAARQLGSGYSSVADEARAGSEARIARVRRS